MNAFRVAAVQAGPYPFDLPRSMDKALALVSRAADAGAHLAVFPEAFLGGYPKGADFGARVGTRSNEGRGWFRRYYENAIDVPGPEVGRLAAAAARTAMHLVMGVIERDGGTLYCTALFFGPDGYLGKHRKLVPTAMERLIWGSGDGSTIPVYPTPGGRIGAVICWENYMPLLRAALYAKGVQIYCAPTVDDRDSWLPTMRHIAIEGRCYVVSACQFVHRNAYPPDYPSGPPAPDEPMIRGGSVIVDPFGEVLAGPCRGEENILTAEADPARIVEGKFDLDVAGHYARPDVFHLVVNEAPRRSAEFAQEASDHAL